MARNRDEYDPDAELPEYVPMIRYDENGEPFVLREHTVEESPIPRSLTIILIILMVLSFAYIGVQQHERNQDLQNYNDNLTAQTKQNTELIKRLQKQADTINANEERLERLVLAISAAKTPEQVKQAIEDFIKSTETANQPSSGASGSSFQQSQSSTNRSTRTTPQPSKTPYQEKPSPEPTSSPTASLTSSPSPTPTATLLPGPLGSVACITLPIGSGVFCV